jgi:hypothetical protein
VPMEPKMARRVDDRNSRQDLDISPAHIAGLCAQTIVLTLQGEMRAEDLVHGTKVITRDSGTAILRLVRRTTCMGHLVAVKAGSLGHKRPPEDQMVPAGTRLLLRDWRADALFGSHQALVEIAKLVDGEFVKLLPESEIDVVELIFDSAHVIYAGGLELSCQTPER